MKDILRSIIIFSDIIQSKLDTLNLHRVAVCFCHPPSYPGIMSRGHIVMDDPEFLSCYCYLAAVKKLMVACSGSAGSTSGSSATSALSLAVILIFWNESILKRLLGFLYHSNESSRSFLISCSLNRCDIQSFPSTVN